MTTVATSALPSLQLDDPTAPPTFKEDAISRWCKRALYEPRDEVFVRLTLKTVSIMAVAMVVLGAFFHWALVPFYLLLWGWYAPPVILMLHCTMHRPFIRRPRWLGRVHPYLMSFFFGLPTGYTEHHMGMHHVEDNMQEDLSSTLRYRRDSFLNFLVYFGRFFFGVLVELTLYLVRKRRYAMARRAFIGELSHWVVVGCAMAYDWRFGLVAFLFPLIAIRFMMMTGNWGQHAFINVARHNDGISNSVSCINTTYNKRCFNDGYHVGHHLKANRHWTEMPQDFLNNAATYGKQGAIVFEGIDFFMVSVLLWTGSWRALAKRYVRLDGPRTDDEVIAMLKSRVQPIEVEAWAAVQPGNA